MCVSMPAISLACPNNFYIKCGMLDLWSCDTVFSRRLIIGLILIGVAFVGISLAGLLASISVSEVNLSWGKITAQTSEVKGVVSIYNPGPLSITSSNIVVSYRMSMNGIVMAEGSRRGIQVGRGHSTMNFSVFFDNTKIPQWWVSHVRDDEKTTVEIDVNFILDLGFTQITLATESRRFTVETNMLAKMNTNEPVDVTIVKPFHIIIKSISTRWGDISDETTEIKSEIVTYNPHMIPITITQLGFEIQMNNVSIGEGETSSLIILKAKTETTINFTTEIFNKKLDDWFVTHLKNGERTVLKIRMFSILRVGDLKVKVYLGTYEEEIRTDLLSFSQS